MPNLFDQFVNTGILMDQEKAGQITNEFNLQKLGALKQEQDMQAKSRQLGMQIAQDNLAKQNNPTAPAVTLANLSEVPDANAESQGLKSYAKETASPATAPIPKQSEVLSQQAADLRRQSMQYQAIGNQQQANTLMDESRKVTDKLYLQQAEERKAEIDAQTRAAGAMKAINSQPALDDLWNGADEAHRKAFAPYFNIALDGKPIYDDKARESLDFFGNKAMSAKDQSELQYKALQRQIQETQAENQRLAQKNTERHQTETEAQGRERNRIAALAAAKKPDLSTVTLTPESIQATAELYNVDKKNMPTRIDAATRSAIINKSTELTLEKGQSTADTPARQAEFKANSGALTSVTKDLSAITPYKEMLDTNIDIAKTLATKAIATDSRLANKSINWLKQNATDNPDVSEYLAQVHFVTTEAARVLSNPRLVGQLTDTAVRDMQGVISGEMPLQSAIRVMDRMKADGNNRVNAMENQHAALVKKMSGGKSSAIPTIKDDAGYAALAPGSQYIAPDGSTRTKAK